ncbi:hypothetical protein AMS68_000632 [Peltaster fructicola]|uniref:Paf1-domain-containing protein n=1 Tax=Peltaster fructicola TaxID=286661 RepID=A0A6H0XKG2_9PEZI|nr:hypothetical protein AMS68_000632 [Peltaster fructicola]
MSSQRPPDRQVYQDYIAKIRYSNQLPPPPNPPKLLDVPGTGLDPKYTSAGYASRLAREQPLNIEADAELGMHIDLIGIPGVFDGDMRAIMADPHPVLHAADKALLRPLASLGKAVGISDSSSFLRRTEYTASSGPQMFASGSSKDLLRLQTDVRRKAPTASNREEPKNILRSVIKGFDIAYPQDAGKSQTRGAEITAEEAKAWSQPRHPSKPKLQLLDSYPILPDLDALPETGSYIVCKLITNPVARQETYDERLNQAVLQPIAGPRIEAEFERKKQEWQPGEREPLPEYDYDYFLPEPDAMRGIKRKFDVQDPENDDEDLYTEENSEGRKIFKYARLRRYETFQQHGDAANIWNDSIGIALHDPEFDVGRVPGTKKRLAKGAYIYPVSQRSFLRPKRKVGVAVLESQDVIDELDITVRDLQQDDETYTLIQEQKTMWDTSTTSIVAAEA